MTIKKEQKVGDYIWLWSCFTCENKLKISGEFKTKWDKKAERCCMEAVQVMRSRIYEHEIEQNQVAKISFLFNNFVLGSLVKDIESEPKEEDLSKYNTIITANDSQPVDRTRHINPAIINSSGYELRLQAPRPQCPICAGDMGQHRDVLKCRKCGYEKIE